MGETFPRRDLTRCPVDYKQDLHTLGYKVWRAVQLVRENLFCDRSVLLKNDQETALMINIEICEY